MSINSIDNGSSGFAGIGAKIRDFRDGKLNISRDDLEETKSSLQSLGLKTTALDKVLGDFDNIDANQDGISFSELSAYIGNKLGTKDAASSHPRTKSFSLDDLKSLREKISETG